MFCTNHMNCLCQKAAEKFFKIYVLTSELGLKQQWTGTLLFLNTLRRLYLVSLCFDMAPN